MESNNRCETISPQDFPWLEDCDEIDSGDYIRIIVELEDESPIYDGYTHKWKLMNFNTEDVDFSDDGAYYGAIICVNKLIYPKSNNSGYVFVDDTISYFECSKDDVPSENKNSEQKPKKSSDIKQNKKDYSPQNASRMGSRKDLGLDSAKINDIDSSKF